MLCVNLLYKQWTLESYFSFGIFYEDVAFDLTYNQKCYDSRVNSNCFAYVIDELIHSFILNGNGNEKGSKRWIL